MKAIIIEDEAQAISALKSELDIHCPDVIVIGEAKTVSEGIEIINNLQPDIVFLDIQLTDGLGFDILSSIKEQKFSVIFTTAYSQFAIKAIKFSALDYLLKPIDAEELVFAIEKHKSLNSKSDFNKIETLLHNLQNPEKKKKIVLQSSDGISVFETDTILKCSAESNYTQIYFTNGKKQLFSKTLKEFEELLENSGFERIHHSHIINLNHLVSFINKDGGYVVLTDKSTVPVSQRKKASLLEALNNFNT